MCFFIDKNKIEFWNKFPLFLINSLKNNGNLFQKSILFISIKRQILFIIDLKLTGVGMSFFLKTKLSC